MNLLTFTSRSLRSVLLNGLWEIEEVRTDIVGDRALLFEAFSNLLDNAIKFAPEHGEVAYGAHEARARPTSRHLR